MTIGIKKREPEGPLLLLLQHAPDNESKGEQSEDCHNEGKALRNVVQQGHMYLPVHGLIAIKERGHTTCIAPCARALYIS